MSVHWRQRREASAKALQCEHVGEHEGRCTRVGRKVHQGKRYCTWHYTAVVLWA